MTTACATQCVTQPVTKTRTITPRANIYGESEKVYVEIELPGVKREDIQVKSEDGKLRLEAKRFGKSDGEAPEPRFTYRRDFRVATNLDLDNISAHYENGILRLELPRKESGRIIPVA